MAKKNGQTVTIKVDLTDEIIDKLGGAIATALSKVVTMDEATQSDAAINEEADTEASPVAEVAQSPAPVEAVTPAPVESVTPAPVEAVTPAPQTAVPNYPQQPVSPVAPQYTQTAVAQAPCFPQATPAQVQNTQPVPVGTVPVVNYPVNEVGPVQQNSVPTNAMPAGASATTAPMGAINLDTLSNAGAELCSKGLMAQCVAALQKYGVAAVNELNPQYYEAFAAELRALGANI